jgi:basic membrane protein A
LRLLLIAVLALCMGTAVACGEDEEPADSGGAAATAEPEKKIKVGMVTDIGGLNDRSFNESAYKGLKRAESELGVEIRAITSKSNADYVPNLSTLARQKFDVVFAVGFLMAEATEKVAKSFPDTKFAIVDFPQDALKSKPANVQGLLFKENEAGYLAATWPACTSRTRAASRSSPPSAARRSRRWTLHRGLPGRRRGGEPGHQDAQRLLAGLRRPGQVQGARAHQIEEGSQVVFQVAGQCGLGALDAAEAEERAGHRRRTRTRATSASTS